MSKNRFVLLLLAVGVALFIGKLRSSRPPHVIVLLADTLRADVLGCYGFPDSLTPRIDALANESMLFTNAIAQSPWTKPSVASLFTSVYPETHRVLSHPTPLWKKKDGRTQISVLSASFQTLAEAFKDKGYATAGFVGNPWLQKEFGFAQGFDLYAAPPNRVTEANRLFAPAKIWLESLSPRQPFFLYLHFMDPHGPYQCTAADLESLKDHPGFEDDAVLSLKEMNKIPPYLRDPFLALGQPLAKRVRNWRACYAAGVQKFDERLGAILDFFQEKGYFQNSIVVFLSDHGEELYDHGGWDHGFNLQYHQTQIPLLIYTPDKKGAGQTITTPVELIDVKPLLLQLAGFSDQEPDQTFAYASGVKHNPNWVSYQTGPYKLIHHLKNDQSLLYNLDTDPQEKNNLASSNADGLKTIKGQLLDHVASLKKNNINPNTAVVPDGLKDELKSLGYMQ